MARLLKTNNLMPISRLLEVYQQCERPQRIGELIELCQPGKYFIGLWVVKIERRGKYHVRWCVSYINKNNVHAETDLYADPIKALRTCAKKLGLR